MRRPPRGGHRVRAVAGNAVEAPLEIPVERGALRRAAGAVEGDRQPRPGRVEAEAVAPMPVMCGSTTPCIATAASAASMALPPAFRISKAARVAAGCDVAAIPCSAKAAERPGF